MKMRWYWKLRDWEQPLWVPGYIVAGIFAILSCYLLLAIILS